MRLHLYSSSTHIVSKAAYSCKGHYRIVSDAGGCAVHLCTNCAYISKYRMYKLERDEYACNMKSDVSC